MAHGSPHSRSLFPFKGGFPLRGAPSPVTTAGDASNRDFLELVVISNSRIRQLRTGHAEWRACVGNWAGSLRLQRPPGSARACAATQRRQEAGPTWQIAPIDCCRWRTTSRDPCLARGPLVKWCRQLTRRWGQAGRARGPACAAACMGTPGSHAAGSKGVVAAALRSHTRLCHAVQTGEVVAIKKIRVGEKGEVRPGPAAGVPAPRDACCWVGPRRRRVGMQFPR